MSLIDFPNVPNVPGVPALLRSATMPTVDSLVNQGISAAVEAIFGAETWGVYDESGNLALDHEAFGGIEYQNAYLVSNYIQEDGAFASYNKVGTPFDCRVKLFVSEDKAARSNFLSALDFMVKKIDTYSLVTPEITYPSATLEGYRYRRTSRRGTRVIEAELMFKEVRKNTDTTKTETATPQAQPETSMGQIQEQAYSLVSGPIEYATDRISDIAEWSQWRIL